MIRQVNRVISARGAGYIGGGHFTFLLTLSAGMIGFVFGGPVGSGAAATITATTVGAGTAGVTEGIWVRDLENEFKIIKQYYGALARRVGDTDNILKNTINAISAEIMKVVNFKAKTSSNKSKVRFYAHSRSKIENSIRALIDECQKYIQRHGGNLNN